MPRSTLVKRTVSADATPPFGPAERQDVAEYVHAMSIELGSMADHADYRLLRYLLDMVRLEAETLLRQGSETVRPPRSLAAKIRHPKP